MPPLTFIVCRYGRYVYRALREINLNCLLARGYAKIFRLIRTAVDNPTTSPNKTRLSTIRSRHKAICKHKQIDQSVCFVFVLCVHTFSILAFFIS